MSGMSTKAMVASSQYNPYDYRALGSGGTQNWQSLIHLLKGFIGTGILAMPKAFSHSGWIMGLLLTALFTFLCCYGILMLARNQYLLCKRNEVPQMTYPQVMKEALLTGPKCLNWMVPVAGPFVIVFLNIYQLGICSIYIIFIGSNIKQVVEYYHDIDVDKRAYYMISFIPMLLLVQVRDLRRLAPFSTLANIITFVGLCIMIYFAFQDFPGFGEAKKFGDFMDFSNFLGTTLFALSAVGVIVSVQSKMIHPEDFGGPYGIMAIAFVTAGFVYGFLGLVGFVKYGDEVDASFTLNMPKDSVLAQSTILLYSCAIFISYGLQAFVPFDMIWNSNLKLMYGDTPYGAWWELGVRCGIVIVTFLMALAIPDLGSFTSLVGALCLSMLGLSFPALIEICVLHPDEYGVGSYLLIKNLLIFAFGFFAMCMGTYLVIMEIVDTYK